MPDLRSVLTISASAGMLAVVTLVGVSSGACSSDDAASDPAGTTSSTTTTTTTSSSGSSPALTPAACQSRCATKSETCGATAAQSTQACTQLCADTISESQARCLEAASCTSLANADRVADVCPATSAGTSGGTSGDSSGTSGKPASTPPTTLKISGTIPSGTKATHVKDGTTLASTISVGPEPTLSPETTFAPNLSDKGVVATVNSPSLGTCKQRPTYTFNNSQIGVVFIGTETLPEAACAKFADDFASGGFKATLTNVPYTNSTIKGTVTIELTR